MTRWRELSPSRDDILVLTHIIQIGYHLDLASYADPWIPGGA